MEKATHANQPRLSHREPRQYIKHGPVLGHDGFVAYGGLSSVRQEGELGHKEDTQHMHSTTTTTTNPMAP